MRTCEHVLAVKGASLGEQGRLMLAGDLRSPCTREVAVLQAFSRVICESPRNLVVVDTAPTGHTLLLLEATGSYHGEVARQHASNAPRSTRRPGSSTALWPPAPPHRCCAAKEIPQVATVQNDHAERVAFVPLLAVRHVDIPALQALADARDNATR